MTRKAIADRISDLLLSESEMSTLWAHAPLVIHLPFMGKREEFFLEVAIHRKEAPNCRETLISECLHIASKIIETGILTDEKGIEIAVYVPGPRNPQRACRLIALTVAYSKLLSAQVADVLSKQIEGLTFQAPLV